MSFSSFSGYFEWILKFLLLLFDKDGRVEEWRGGKKKLISTTFQFSETTQEIQILIKEKLLISKKNKTSFHIKSTRKP